MPDDLREKVAKIMASATKVDNRQEHQDPSIAIYGGCVYVAGDIHIGQTQEHKRPAANERRDLILVMDGFVITLCVWSMATPVLGIKIGAMTAAVVLAWTTILLGWRSARTKQRDECHRQKD